jgi:hypothetical protein
MQKQKIQAAIDSYTSSRLKLLDDVKSGVKRDLSAAELAMLEDRPLYGNDDGDDDELELIANFDTQEFVKLFQANGFNFTQSYRSDVTIDDGQLQREAQATAGSIDDDDDVAAIIIENKKNFLLQQLAL